MIAPSTINRPAVGGHSHDDLAIQACGCGTATGLLKPTTHAPASTWLCCRCGSVFFAQREGEIEPTETGIRRVSYYEVMKAIYVYMDGDTCPVLQKDAQRWARSSGSRNYLGREFRKQKRFAVAAPVTAVPLSDNFRVSGHPARIMTVNVSGGGSALLHGQQIFEPFLAIDFAASGIDLLPAILHVTRTRKLATGWEIAGKFVSRVLP
jgi:hypothetical protein